MSDLRVVQLEDKNHNPITPYTAAASVYVNANEEWTNVETLIGAMDIDAVQNAQAEALDSIEEQRVESVTKIQEEGDSYRNDIDTISGSVKTLDEKVFPLVITEPEITAKTNVLKFDYKYRVTEYGSNVIGANIVVQHAKNDSDYTNLYSGNIAGQTLGDIDMSWGRDRFYITVRKEPKKPQSQTRERYLFVHGSCGETITVDEIMNTSVMARTSASSSFSCTVNTTSTNKYVWIGVPRYRLISKVTTSDGFEFKLKPTYIVFQVNGMDYRLYRSLNDLSINVWSLTVSTTSA